jgi:hypothetical protein
LLEDGWGWFFELLKFFPLPPPISAALSLFPLTVFCFLFLLLAQLILLSDFLNWLG